MTDQEWGAIALLLSKGWKGSFGPGEERAYRTLLDGYEPEAIVVALRRLVAEASPFIPAVSEIVQAINADPGRPTFAEAFSALFDRGGVLSARSTGVFVSEAAMVSARNAAALERAWEVHPLLGRFVEAYGAGRLRMLGVDDPDVAGVVRRDLEGEWSRFVAVEGHRDAAALAAGRRREVSSGGLRRMSPLAAVNQSGEEG